MNEKTERHQVVIVGGSIMGVTLALCLERLQVDYVLLEAYGDLTPDPDASVVLFAHAQRVLGQLGLGGALARAALPQADIDYRDGATGRGLGRRSMWDELRRRHGHGNLWTSRHRLLRVLHGAVADRGRLWTHWRMTRIDDDDDAARVHTADGLHNVVRREMWRHADRAGPVAVPAADRGEVGKAAAAMKDVQDMIRLLTWRGWLDRIIYRYVVPYAPMWLLLRPHSAAVVSGTHLKGIFEAPKDKHDWTYKDEMKAEK